jgi:hypothetical protein
MNDEQYFIIINDIRYNLSYDANRKIIIKNSLNNQIINYSSVQYQSLDDSITEIINPMNIPDMETVSVKYKIIDKSIIEDESKNNLSLYIYILIIIIMIILIISAFLFLIIK